MKFNLLEEIGQSAPANGVAILITCIPFFLKIVVDFIRKIKIKGKHQTILGKDLIACDWAPYCYLILAPIINGVIYFISIIFTYLEHFWIVQKLSQNQVNLLNALICGCVVFELSFFVVFGVKYKQFIRALWEKIAYYIFNFEVACFISIIWDYMIFLVTDNYNILSAYLSAIPIYIWGMLIVFSEVYLRYSINSNSLIQLDTIIGFGSISVGIVLLFLGVQKWTDFLFAIWILTLIIYISLYSYCWCNVEGVIYLNGYEKKDVICVYSCLEKENKISYLKYNYAKEKREEVNVEDFVKMQWTRRVYCPRRQIKEVTFFNGIRNEKIIYTEKKKCGKNFTRFVNRNSDKTAIITVVKTKSINYGETVIADERIIMPFVNKIGHYILSKNII